MSELKQLKASAGSGKTYSLTNRFLDLLQGARPARENTGFACRSTLPPGHSWPEILAVTFTNKAAAEMKERIVSSLKRTALNIPEGQRANWPAAQARETLERMLRRYHQLNIRTIDSLLNLLLRVFALEAGVHPDFEIVFDEAELFDGVLDRFLAACEEDNSPELELFDRAVETLLSHEERHGFFLSDIIRKRLLEVLLLLRTAGGDFCTDQKAMADLLQNSYGSYLQGTEDLANRIKSRGLHADKRVLNFLNKCLTVKLFKMPPESAYARKPSIIPCLLKKSQGLVDDGDEAYYARFKERYDRYVHEASILGGAYALAPVTQLAELLLDRLNTVERERGQVLGAGLPRRVREMLEFGGGAPDAFCRLGGRLHHLLIDEFQDTSRDQWGAITPLAEECLSKGGSLFYVGDVKQAIYSWRGGDATLFDEVGQRPELANMVDKSETENLPHNWRSLREVVTFNNDFFSALADSDVATDVASQCLGKEPPADEVATLRRAIQGAFGDAPQTIDPSRHADGGYVRIERLPGGTSADIVEQTLDGLVACLLDDLAKRRPWKDIAVLVRGGKQAAAVCDRLVACGVPVITESSLRLDRHPVVRQLAALLAFIDRPEDDLAFAEILLGDEIFLLASGLTQDTVLDWLAEQTKRPLWLAFKHDFPDVWEHVLRPFARKSGLMTPYDLVADAARFFKVLENHPESELYLRRFLEVVHKAGECGMGSLAGFLDFWRTSSDEEKVPLPESIDAVRILTIHKSKGLEFPVVLVPFHNWKGSQHSPPTEVQLGGQRFLTPNTKHIGSQYFERLRREAQEELHLLYVERFVWIIL